jgi:hypothetical protein
MMHILRGGVVFVLAVVAGGVWAADVSIGGVPITLPPPAGFCDLTASQPADNRALTMVGGAHEKAGNRLLAFSADCQQLADWRAGKRPFLDNIAQVLADIADMDKTVASPKAFIHATCAKLRATQGNPLDPSVTSDIKSRIEAASATVRLNSLEIVGVLGEDDTACYMAQIEKMTENGVDSTVLNLISITVVKNKLISVTRFDPYTGADATPGLFKKLQDTIAALHAANR